MATLIDIWQRAGERLNLKHINKSKRPRLMEKIKLYPDCDVWILDGRPTGNRNDTATLKVALVTSGMIYLIEDAPDMYDEGEVYREIKLPLEAASRLLHAFGMDEAIDVTIENRQLKAEIETKKKKQPVGRPVRYKDAELISRIRTAASSGESFRSIAKREKMSPTTVSKLVQQK